MNKTGDDINFLQEVLNQELPLEAQVNVLFEILDNVLDKGAVRARTVKYKLSKYVSSSNICERVYALNMIASDGKGLDVVPSLEEIEKVLQDTADWIAECIA